MFHKLLFIWAYNLATTTNSNFLIKDNRAFCHSNFLLFIENVWTLFCMLNSFLEVFLTKYTSLRHRRF